MKNTNTSDFILKPFDYAGIKISFSLSYTITRVILILFYALFFLLFFPANFSLSQWVKQNSGTTAHLGDVFFINENYGWAIGNNAVIIHTKDGGNTWVTQHSPVSNVRLFKVHFINESVGFIAGEKTILKTTNSGELWYELNTGVPHDFRDIAVLDKNTLVAVGGWLGNGNAAEESGIVIRSTDGGRSWDEIIRTRWGDDPGRHFFTAVEFINENTGWMLGGAYMDNFNTTSLYETTDGGINWNIISEILYFVTILSTISENAFWVGNFDGAISTDRGNKWNRLDFTNPADTIFQYPGYVARYFEQITDYKTYVIVNKLDRSETTLRYTEDAGVSWIKINLPDSIPILLSMDKVKDKLWAVGFEGTIIYTDNILTGIKNENNELVDNSISLTAYPNPFNSSTTITYTLKEKSNVSLTIYDILGRELEVLVNTTQDAGEYKVPFSIGSFGNASQYASGVYIYQLRVNGKTFMKKMLLTK